MNTPTIDSIIKKSIELRHLLHRRPELSWQEEQTAALIRSRLDELDIPWRVCATHGTVATLVSEKGGAHVALRADMDAMEVMETADLDFRSEVEGCMHACGHDGHIASLLAMAAWLKLHEKSLPGSVSLLFQPAEEGGHGAREMIADGALDGIDLIYGYHNWPAIPFGRAVCPDGPIMSGNGTFHITLQGKGGHASQPEVCRDPVLAAAAVTLNLQQIVSRRMAPQSATVVSVGSIEGPGSAMVTPEYTRLEGSIRLSQPELREQINQLIEQITKDTARSYGVTAEIEIRSRYDATINHTESAEKYRQALAKEFGHDWRMDSLPLPIMASEDFSYYLQEIPGAYALIGNAVGDDFAKPCHSPSYKFNDKLIEPLIRIFSCLVGAPCP